MRVNKRQVQLLPKHPIDTMPGFGWLREAPRPRAPVAKLTAEEVVKHAALRKCIYFPAMVPQMASASAQASARAAERVRTNPDLFRPPLRKRNTPVSADMLRRAPKPEPHGQPAPRVGSSLEDPISVGILLAVLPPIGFMMLWGSQRYSRDAKLAITALMTVFMVLATAAVCTALIVLR
jgi:hypothetical protein